MSVYKPKGSPYFHFDFQWKGRRFYGATRLTSKTDAKRLEAEKKRELSLGKKERPQITLDQMLGTWWLLRGQKRKSANTTRYQIGNLLDGLGRNVAVSDIGFAELQDYSAKRRASVSDTSVNRETELYRCVWRFMAKRNEFDLGEQPDWKDLLYREPKERVRELGSEEEAALFACLPRDLAAVVEFAMLSGQRRTSIIRMRWSDVKLTERRATVVVKGGSTHTFPLTPRLLAIVANQPKVAAQVFTYECARPAPPKGKQPRRLKGERYPFSLQGWTRKWRRALAEAGVDDFRFHDLRHTAATRIVRSSGNLKIAQKLLGHSSITTTARYAHATEGDVLAAMISAESRTIPEVSSGAANENPVKSVSKG